MSDPPRLSTNDPHGLGATLLRAAHGDDPPATSRQRMLAAVSVGAEAWLAAGTASGGAAASGAASGVAAMAVKWAGIGIAAGAISVTAVQVVAPRVSPAPPRAEVASVQTGSVVIAEPPRALAPEVLAEKAPQEAPASPPRAVDLPVPAAPLARTAPPALPVEPTLPAPHLAAPEPSVVSLADEVSALDRARDAALHRQPQIALDRLDRYDRAFPRGRLALESEVLRIEALAQVPDRDRAEKLARQFIAEHPASAHVARVRSLLTSLQKGASP